MAMESSHRRSSGGSARSARCQKLVFGKILREADADQDGVLSFSEYLDAVSNLEVSA